MTSLPLHLQDQLKVTPSRDPGNVDVTVTLPAESVSDYVQLLESLSGLLQYAKRKAHYAELRSKVTSQEHAQEVNKRITDYRAFLVERYDYYIDQGNNRSTSIHLISKDLKADGHPWHYVDQVRPNLIAAGRPGQPGRRRKS